MKFALYCGHCQAASGNISSIYAEFTPNAGTAWKPADGPPQKLKMSRLLRCTTNVASGSFSTNATQQTTHAERPPSAAVLPKSDQCFDQAAA
jgi:hypothetical protein